MENGIIDNFPFNRIVVDLWYIEHRHPNSTTYQKPVIDHEFIKKWVDPWTLFSELNYILNHQYPYPKHLNHTVNVLFDVLLLFKTILQREWLFSTGSRHEDILVTCSPITFLFATILPSWKLYLQHIWFSLLHTVLVVNKTALPG